MIQVSRAAGALATSLLVLTLSLPNAAAQSPDAPLEAPPCASRLPANVNVQRELLKRVATMLARSATFRDQCRRLAETPWMHVRVMVKPELDRPSLRALSTIKRPQPRLFIALVDVAATADPTMWLPHEFEHLIEQLDSVDVEKQVDDGTGAWRVSERMYETTRAIRAGETVYEEVHTKRRQDNFVD